MYTFIASHNPVVSNARAADFFFLDPNGIIYPSVIHNFVMGDIKAEENIEKFGVPKRPKMLGNKVDNSKIPVWMICTARTAIKTSGKSFALGSNE